MRTLKLKNTNKNEKNKTSFHLFDENNLEKNMHKDLALVNKLLLNTAEEITISTCSSLILICLPILKRIENLKKIILIINKGKEPSELLRIAKILKANDLLVKVKYANRNRVF